MRLSVMRIDRGRFFEQGLRHHIVLTRDAPIVR